MNLNSSARLKVTKVRCYFGSVLLICVLFFSQSCVKYSSSTDFVPVIVKQGDTLSSLAEKYFDDPKKGWVIGDFNRLNSVSAGQEIIIPLKPVENAGLSRQGYQTVPIIVYHNFSETNETPMMVKKNDFLQQMEYLKNNNYVVITLDELFDFLEDRKQLPRKAVVITIDDGWAGVYSIAFPILKKYGYPATLFVYTDLISGNKKTLDWEQVAELDKNGIDIQCHTKSHRNLNKAKDKETLQTYISDVQNEIMASTQTIEKRLKKKVKYLAYPYGDTNNLIIGFLQTNGYRGAFTVNRDANPFFGDRFSLNRSMIYGDFDLNAFRKNLKLYSSRALN